MGQNRLSGTGQYGAAWVWGQESGGTDWEIVAQVKSTKGGKANVLTIGGRDSLSEFGGVHPVNAHGIRTLGEVREMPDDMEEGSRLRPTAHLGHGEAVLRVNGLLDYEGRLE